MGTTIKTERPCSYKATQTYNYCFGTSIPFPTLAKFVNAEDIRDEKVRTLDLPVETNLVVSKLEFQILSAETYDPNPENMFIQTTDPKLKVNLIFVGTIVFFHESNHSVSNCFCKPCGDEKTSGILILVWNHLLNHLIIA